jgi:YggT family protein
MQSLLIHFDTVIQLYTWVLLIFIIMTWLVHFKVVNPSNRAVYVIMDFSHRITDPVLRRIRNFLPDLGGLDISPIILILALHFIRNFINEQFTGSPY